MEELENKYYTYLWLREDGTPYYVGKGKDQRAFINGDHNVYKPPDDSRIILQYHRSDKEALIAEKFLISFYGRLDIGTGCLRNRTDGGWGGNTSMYVSQEVKKKRRESMLGNTYSLGLKRSPETRAKMSEAARNRKDSKHRIEYCRQMAMSNKGRQFSDEHIRKLKAAKVGQIRPKGYKLSEETKARMSAAHIKRHKENGKISTTEPTESST